MRGLILFFLSIVLFTFLRFAWKILVKNVEVATRTTPAEPSPSTQASGGELIACARCGTYVVASNARHASRQGRDFMFCSEQCKQLGVSAL